MMAVLLINQGLRDTAGGSAAVLTALLPVSAVVLSILVLHEPFREYHAAGVITAIIVMSLKTKRQQVEQAGPE